MAEDVDLTQPSLFDNDPEMPPRTLDEAPPPPPADEQAVVLDTSTGTNRRISGVTWFALAVLVGVLVVGQWDRVAALLPSTTEAQASTETTEMVTIVTDDRTIEDRLNIPTMTAEKTGPYALLAGSFRRLDFAKRLVLQLRDSGTEAHIASVRIPERGVFHRVVIDLGMDPSFGEIIKLKQTAEPVLLSGDGYGTPVTLASVLKRVERPTIAKASSF